MADNSDGQTAYLTAENLGVKITELAETVLTTQLYCAVLWRTQGSVASLLR
jgi:hypothetical protein